MNVLDDISKLYGTDKSSECHNYCVKYEKYLPFHRHDELNILEIGVLYGKSLKVWKDYFYRSQILGIDITPECKQYEENRIKVEIGSQIDEKFLSDISNKYGPFDMILDDGSHINKDVIYSFERLFPSVKSGGVYIIEDVGTSYWGDYGGGIKEPKSTINYFKQIIDEVNFLGEFAEVVDPATNNIIARLLDRREDRLITQFQKKENIYFGSQMESINFLNGIILITKR